MRLHGYTPPVVAAAGPEVSMLGMVAVYPLPEQAEALAIDGGLEAADLHCTLVFLGEVADIDDDAVHEAAAAVAGEVAALEGTVGGAGAFAEGPDGVPVILLPDVKGLTMLRERLVDALRERGVESPSEHGFLPHMTLIYDEGEVTTDLDDRLGLPVTFVAVSVKLGEERTDYPLDGSRTAGGMWTTGTPDEIAAATQAASERIQSDEHVEPLASAYEEVLARLSRRIVKALRAGATVLADGEEVPDRQFVPPDEDEVIDRAALEADVTEVLGAAHRDAARVVVAELDDEGISYDVDTVFTDELLGRIGQATTDQLEAEARKQYRLTIEVAGEHGWSVASTAEAMGNKMSEIAPHTARAMARTDLNGLANGGSLHVAQQALATQEQPVYKTWLATPDERTRETHVDADGQTVPINDNFKVGGFDMPYPGYPFAPLEEVINCRCTITYTSDPTGQGKVVTDPDQAEPDPLAMVTPGDDMLEAGNNDFKRWADGEMWGDHEDAKGVSPQQYAADLEAKLATELAPDKAVVAIRSPADIAVAIAEDGRFKSQFESGRSGGMLSPTVRSTAERDLFSYPREHPAEQRPIYGYMRGPTRETVPGAPATVDMYGNTVWVLKADVRSRTTFTANDSLGLNYVPSPINRPSHLSANPRHLNRVFTDTDPLTTPIDEWDVAYIEAQVHGGVTLADVAFVEVEYYSDPEAPAIQSYAEIDAQAIRDALARAGYGHIEVRLVDIRSATLRRSLRASLEQSLGLGEHSGSVDVGTHLVPVAPGEHAEPVEGLADRQVPPVEHPDGGGVDAVAAALDEQHERVVATLSNHGHATDDTSGGGGSQPSDPLPFPSSDREEAPMGTTTDNTTAPAEALEADGNGEIELAPVGWDAVLAVEDHPTEDGRLLVRGSTSWRDLPLSLMGMLETSDYGHVGAKVAGRIDSITRVANDIASAGELTSAFGINELAPLIADRTVRGVSVDLAVLEWEYRDRDTGETLSDDDLFMYWLEGKEEQVLFAVLDGVIVGATVCPMPAISSAEISLAASAGLSDAGRAILADALGPDRRSSLPDVPLIRVFTPFDRQRTAQPLIAAAPLVELEPATRAHFELTEFPGKTPLTVTEPGEDGWRRVFGHIATWDTCHVGIPGVCTTAPRSYTTPPYALFHQAQYLTLEGDTIDVGSLMLGTGHAGLAASRMEATKHYDKPDMVGARVRAVDGEYGIWVSGVARAELTDAGLRELRENPPSGDWRSYNGHLELVAVCAVAVPGFPVVADAQANITAAGGTVDLSALIASSGTITPSDAVKAAMVAAGCACEDMATSDEGYVDELADVALS